MLKNSLKIALFFSFLFAPNARSALNIGVIAPLAGEYQKVGEELVSGVRTAVDEINSQGGLKGEKINLIMVDDQCDVRIAVSTAQMMAVNVSERDKMSLVIGPYCSNALQKIAGIYAKAGILQIIPTSVSTSIQNGNYKGLVKMVGYKTRQAGDYFKFYQDHFPDRKVALIYDRNDKDVVEVAAAVQKLFADAGKTAAFQSYNFQNYDDDYDSRKVRTSLIHGNLVIVTININVDDNIRLVRFLHGITSLLLLAPKTEGTSRPPITRRYCSHIPYIRTSTNPTSQTACSVLPNTTSLTQLQRDISTY